MVALCLELHTLLCNELCLIVVEEAEMVLVFCPREELVDQYSYMGDVQEYVKGPIKLMIFVMVVMWQQKRKLEVLVVAIVVAVETGIDCYMG